MALADERDRMVEDVAREGKAAVARLQRENVQLKQDFTELQTENEKARLSYHTRLEKEREVLFKEGVEDKRLAVDEAVREVHAQIAKVTREHEETLASHRAEMTELDRVWTKKWLLRVWSRICLRRPTGARASSERCSIEAPGDRDQVGEGGGVPGDNLKEEHALALADKDRESITIAKLEREKQKQEEARMQIDEERAAEKKMHAARMERELSELKMTLEDKHARALSKVERITRCFS